MIRVCIADDQALIRSGLKALLTLFEGIVVCTEAADGEAAVASVATDRPDVLLLDVRMPKLTGVEVVETLAARGVLPPTLLLTTFEDDAALVAGVRAGARGFLLKAVTAETLVEAIRTVAGGGTYLFAPLAEGLEAARTGAWRDDAFETPDALLREVVRRRAANGVGIESVRSDRARYSVPLSISASDALASARS
jgi:DNA-binding NarL/FixJ family response regulator